MITTVKITQFGHRPSWKQYALCLVIAITFCQLSANSTVTAATYYLDTNGSDNANGLSVGTAWKTIARALPNWSGTGSKVTSGDTVILKAGNYGGFEANNVSGTGWITYKADVNLTAVFDRIYVINHSRSNVYFRFDGIRVQHPSTYWPTPNGLWHSQDPLAPGNVVQISNANYVQLLNGKYSGYEKYISRGVYVEYSDYVTIDKCEVTCTRDGIEGNSCIGFILRNCHVHNMSEGSGIRVENTATGSRFENNHVHDQHPHNDAEIATATTNDRYFPYKESTDYAFHPGSGFSIRSSDIVIRNNMLHDGFSQGIMFYNGYTYHNITVENNLFYDTGPIKFLLIDGPVTIRNNTFVGCISLEGTGMYDLIQRYSGTPFEMSFSGSFDGKSVVVTNNIVVGHGTLPSTSLAYTENYNLYWKTMNSDNQIITPKGSRSLQAIWLAGSDLHGYPNNFEDTGFIGTTAEYNYSRDGIRRFFINPGYYTNDYSPALDGGTGKTYDYHLASNSSGINYGDATNQPSDSLGSIGGDGFINNDGPTRDSSHHSVGCYEFSGSVPNPEPNNPNPPNADAGPDQTATASAASGTALVTLDGSHSSSPDGSIVSYVWTERGGQIAAVATPTVPLSIGQHTITLQVTDGSGLTDTDTVVITVEEMTADITPPSIISVTASESSVEIQF
ncbi:MAG: right-handed parallel beta-helix repeat-containing protein, partial [Sedimentisphaerales bacterium]